MHKGRLEAFSDGVIAILITIMVLELKAPDETTWHALGAMKGKLATYVLSFVFLAIYWNNHHHMFQAIRKVNGKVLWANTHLLFWLSLVPFVTAWIGEHYLAPIPTAVYGAVLLCSGVAYTILLSTIVANEGADSTIAQAVGDDVKGTISLVCYVAAIPLAFVHTLISDLLYVAVVFIWLIPDRRIERRLDGAE